MKHITAFICLLLTFIAPPALALQGNDCAARSEKVKPAEQADFMKSCLAQAEAPANVKEEERKHKNALCEQNAKNKKLQGNDKANYQSNCMNKNEAAVVASTKPQNTIDLGGKSTPSRSEKPAAKKEKQVKKEHKKKKEQ